MVCADHVAEGEEMKNSRGKNKKQGPAPSTNHKDKAFADAIKNHFRNKAMLDDWLYFVNQPNHLYETAEKMSRKKKK